MSEENKELNFNIYIGTNEIEQANLKINADGIQWKVKNSETIESEKKEDLKEIDWRYTTKSNIYNKYFRFSIENFNKRRFNILFYRSDQILIKRFQKRRFGKSNNICKK